MHNAHEYQFAPLLVILWVTIWLKRYLPYFSLQLINDMWHYGFSLMAQIVKNLPAMQRTWIWSLVWEDPLEERMATHSNIFAWRIPMDSRAWWASPWGHKELYTTERLTHTCDIILWDNVNNLFPSIISQSFNTGWWFLPESNYKWGFYKSINLDFIIPSAFIIWHFCSFSRNNFIGIELIYSVVLVSGVQQSDSVIQIHISTLF